MVKKLKQMPSFATDEEAERFVDEADLSEYDFSGMTPMRYKFGPTIDLNIQLPQGLLDDVKTLAAKDGVPISASFGRCWKMRWRRGRRRPVSSAAGSAARR